jgi:hypothetical protein
MPDEIIKVQCHSGYRTEERPLAFILNNETINIVEILDRWIEEGIHDKIRKRYFQVKGSDGLIHKIYFIEKTKEWFICKI